MPGKDGKPGIQAYKVNMNDYNENDILIPPSIIGEDYCLSCLNKIVVSFSFFMQIV